MIPTYISFVTNSTIDTIHDILGEDIFDLFENT